MLGMKEGQEAWAALTAHQSWENLQIIETHHAGSEETCLSRCWDVAKNAELTEDRAWARVQVCWHMHIWITGQSSCPKCDEECSVGRPRKHVPPTPPTSCRLDTFYKDSDCQNIYSSLGR